MVSGLPDLLAENLGLVFVGYNPGERSEQLGHHFAGRNNQFWQLLHDSGLTARRFPPEDDQLLLPAGIGLTNLVDRMTRSSADLTPADLKAGAETLRSKLDHFRPAVVCFLGKEIYRHYAGLKPSYAIEYGLVKAGPPRLFVAPNPSGRSTVKYETKLALFSQLRDVID